MAAGFTADPALPEASRSHPITATVGTTGLRQTSGYVREEFLRDLQGLKGREVYHEMSLNDSTAGAVLFAIKMLLRSVEWSVVPTDADDTRAVEAAELIEGMLFEDMQHTWPEGIESACSMFTYGFALQEVLWKKRRGSNVSKPWLSSDFDDGLWAPRALSSRSQRTIDRWVFDAEGNIVGFEQQPQLGGRIIVPMSRCLHFRTTAEIDNPEGASILRTAYRPYYFLKRLQEIEGVGTERDLAGYPVLRVPAEILKGDTAESLRARQSFEEMLKNVRRDNQEGVMLPSDRDENGNPYYDFSLMSSGGSRQLRIDESINRYQKDIARSVLADFIFLGADGGGSLALGRTKVQTFTLAMKAYLQHIKAQYNEDLIPMIWRINGLDDEIRPELDHGEIEPADLEALGAYIKNLSGVGYDLATDTELENHLRTKGDLPPAPERDDEDFPPLPGMPRYDPQARPPTRSEPPPENENDDELTGVDKRGAFWDAVMEGFDAG